MTENGNLRVLLRRHGSLPEIFDYFHGTPTTELEIPRNIIVIGRSERRPPSTTPSAHHRFLLVVNLRGGGSVILDGVRHYLRPAQCLLIFPHQHHHFLRDAKDISWIFITFELSASDRLTALRGQAMDISETFLEYLEMLTRGMDSVEKLHSEPGSIMLLTALLLHEATSLGPAAGTPPPLDERQRFADAVNRHLHDNLHRQLTAAQVAKKFALSPSHFRAKYRAAMGVGVGSYAHNLRIHKAQALLRGTDMSVGDIASACGYRSPYAFSHAFKNAIGAPPLAYRNGAGAR